MTRVDCKAMPFRGPLLVALFGLIMTGCAKPAFNVRGVRQYEAVEIKDASTVHGGASLPESSERSTPLPTPELSAEGYESSGDICLRNGDVFMALLQYERALKIGPKNARLYYKEGMVFLAAEQYDDAINAFKKSLAKETQNALAYEGLGQAHYRKKAYTEAKDNFLKALALDPSLWKAYTFLGMIYDRERKFDLAVREYAAAISQRPNDGLLYNNLGVSYLLAGRYREAVRSFQKALETSVRPKEKIYNNLGLALCGLSDYDGALDAFRKAGGEAEALNNMGCVFLSNGEPDKAIGYFKKAIESSPEFYALASENMRKARMAKQMK
jgi:tetratricopeptide (TPR) repeat protein